MFLSADICTVVPWCLHYTFPQQHELQSQWTLSLQHDQQDELSLTGCTCVECMYGDPTLIVRVGCVNSHDTLSVIHTHAWRREKKNKPLKNPLKELVVVHTDKDFLADIEGGSPQPCITPSSSFFFMLHATALVTTLESLMADCLQNLYAYACAVSVMPFTHYTRLIIVSLFRQGPSSD